VLAFGTSTEDRRRISEEGEAGGVTVGTEGAATEEVGEEGTEEYREEDRFSFPRS
jgi:hypothetical protein